MRTISATNKVLRGNVAVSSCGRLCGCLEGDLGFSSFDELAKRRVAVEAPADKLTVGGGLPLARRTAPLNYRANYPGIYFLLLCRGLIGRGRYDGSVRSHCRKRSVIVIWSRAASPSNASNSASLMRAENTTLLVFLRGTPRTLAAHAAGNIMVCVSTLTSVMARHSKKA
jgi:hypothetical protein